MERFVIEKVIVVCVCLLIVEKEKGPIIHRDQDALLQRQFMDFILGN
jgi:hypothetical protein